MSLNPSTAVSQQPSTWFVTGANRGLGAAICRAALHAGHRVVATGRDAAAVQRTFAGEAGINLLTLALDVTDHQQAQAAVEAAIARFGQIDVLVNNAGYGQLGYFEEVSVDAIQTQFNTNVFGLMNVTRAVLPTMREQRRGHVFNLSSIGGLTGFPGSSLYCATKFAVEGFSASLAPELAPFGIRVTTVAPGFFRTDFLDPRSVKYGDSAHCAYTEASSALRSQFDGFNHRQPGDPAKLANALLEIAQHPEPPLHFVAGSDAIGMALAELDRLRADIEDWRGLSELTGSSD